MANLYDPVEPVVETKYGKVRGYTFGEVNHFSFFIAREEGILMREEIEQKMIKTARAL